MTSGNARYAVLDSRIGRLVAAVSDDGLLFLTLPREDAGPALAGLERALGTAPREDASALAPLAAELDAYFAGELEQFATPLDWRLASGMRLRLLQELARVPYGTTVSYGELAARTGIAHGARAAGQACATNPIPIVVPCHRVLRSDGTLGGYGGGLKLKAELLELEGVQTGAGLQLAHAS